MGVDLFFVLSGFLIAYILMKECDKYDGEIDIGHFLLNRFWRLFPVLFWYDLLPFLGFLADDPRKGIWKLKDFFFLSNLEIGEFDLSPIWSVAVEF